MWSREDLLAGVKALADGRGAPGRNLEYYTGQLANELRGILEDAAADPSLWVRERAKEALRDLEDED